MRKWIFGAVAVVLAGLLWYTARNAESSDPRAAYKELSQVTTKLEKAGTARVEFVASLRGGEPFGAWEGSSLVRFAGPNWDTTYTKMNGSGAKTPTITARRLHVAGADYYSSPDLVAADQRPWYEPSKTVLNWGDPLSNPQLNVADITTWLPFFGDLDVATADAAKIGDHKYRLECMSGRSVCPPPFGTKLDDHFNQTSPPILTAELDGDGWLKKLDVECVLTYAEPAGGGSPGDVALHPRTAYHLVASFKLSKFGEKVEVQAPDPGTVTGSDRVSPKS
ncbi:hypothetical protein [Actinoplanes sp. L3-i22]|uniref:hypothetical protein n=1 Tax=Actinoplanes sp. L3-i22 TaxID=2836373 RepID=UPI001C75ED91|nr:hypothetical protein [Actinoplanes sp. L3-i22]BCY06450.1 hypothetical protein L3i22_015380 [Actinoplanes sp. L3-i22]